MSGMKRLQAVVLAVCLMLLGVMGTSAAEVHADVEDTFTAEITNVPTGSPAQEINCTFKILEEPGSNGKGKVQVGDGYSSAIDKATDGSIKIPSEVMNSNKTYIVTSIGDRAFFSCENLTSTGLDGNSSVTEIGDVSFWECSGLINTGLESNSTVTSIGSGVFEDCKDLTSTGLERNSTVTNIGENAFRGCTGLESTGLENNCTIKNIGNGVFEDCKGLTSTGLERNSTVTNIGGDAFRGCTGLESTGLKSNSKVTEIGNSAFEGCSGLTSTGLESNSTVTNIGAWAFVLCTSLENVTLPKDSKVATIGDQAFAYCANLQSFVIKGDKVPAFGSDVFFNTLSDFTIYYPVHVINGSAAAAPGKQIDSSFAAGATITITANPADTGKKFKNWSVDSGGVSLADSKSTSTTFAMPEEVVKVTANYEAIEYIVTVDGGTGGGTYVMNDRVTITADQAPEGKRFKEWQVVSGKAALADPAKETTTFTMPAGNVEVKTVYEDIPAGHKGGTTPPGDRGKAKADTPQTSDPFNSGLLLFIMLAAGIIAIVSYGTRKKKAK